MRGGKFHVERIMKGSCFKVSFKTLFQQSCMAENISVVAGDLLLFNTNPMNTEWNVGV